MSFFDYFLKLKSGPDIVFLYEFHKPPYGGGNQFLLALRKEIIKQGYSIGSSPGSKTKAVLMNSFNFDQSLPKRWKKVFPNLHIVHRLGGPIGIYRGTDIKIDKQTQKINSEFADATIFISNFSANKYMEIGLKFKNPRVIINTIDPEIFNQKERITAPDGKRKIKLIATAWSDNPKKGGPILEWLDKNLNQNRYELTFVGRTKAAFRQAKVLPPVPSEEVANILKQHDIYIAASEDDPCSNALLEALACGLPAAYRSSGGHPEIVKEAGVAFNDGPSLLEAVEKISKKIDSYRNKINLSNLSETAKKYLEILCQNQ
ncbi:glycosyltransferase [Candidatus Parcubacteria bacterium]|nr:MAG: glycosyltransferase [Candidatus Parcubacteria bacterium]